MSNQSSMHALTRAEIASQPEMWRRAADGVRDGRLRLPPEGERVLVLGCGTSFYVGQAFAMLREAAGCGVTDAVIASEVPTTPRDYDRVVAISRSGTSSELIDAVRQFPNTPVTAWLGEQDTALADVSDEVIDLSFADERSVVQTRFPSTILAMVYAGLFGPDSVAVQAETAEVALSSPLPDADIRHLVILARGWAVAVASEAALKVRESAGAWVEAYPTGEFRHGPISVVGPGSLVWGIGPLDEPIVSQVKAAGAIIEQGGDQPLAELVRLHRFALEVATLAGRDADRPIGLSRSVILDDDAGAGSVAS